MKVKHLFVVTLVVVGVVLSASILVGFQQYKDTLYEQEREELNGTATQVRSQLSTYLSAQAEVLEVGAKNPSLTAANGTRRREALDRFVGGSAFSGASVIDANGTMRTIVAGLESDTRRDLVGADFSDRRYFRQAMQGRTYVSSPFRAASGHYIVTISTPIRRDGTVVGTLNGAFHLSQENVFATVSSMLKPGQGLVVYSQRGTTLYDTSVPAGPDPMVRNASLSETGWTVSVRGSRADLQATIQTVTYVQIGALLTVILMLGGAGLWVYRRNISQLERLLAGFTALENEEYGTQVYLGGAEEWRKIERGFNQLSQSLDEYATERDRQFRELEEQRQKYSTLVEQSHEGVVIVQDGDYVFVNQEFEELTGLSESELLGRPFYDVIAPEYHDLVRERHERRIAGENPPSQYDIELVTADGDRRHVEIEVSSIRYEGDPATLATFFDITERKERERALARYERLVENLPIGVYQTTPGPDGEFRLVNDGMVELFDADSKADLRDRSVSDLYVDSEEREAFSERLREEGVVEGREVQLRTLSGERLWAEVTAIVGEENGETVFDGAIVDVTERKEYENRLEEQRDDLEMLNEMVRHDIRNDLQLILAWGEVLEESVEGEQREHLDRILDSARNAVALTKTARDLAEVMLQADTANEPVDLKRVVSDELDRIRSATEDAVVTVEGSLPAVSVRANEMLDSVFRNLLKNAVEHNDEDVPEVTVSATVEGDSVRVRVADNGPGVPDEQKEAIFGKGEKGLDSEGTGIGLYLVHTLVERYGGDVWVEDTDPKGAVFVVELPVAE